MPELPEVETVRAGLEPVLVGRRLARVEARRPDLRFPLPDDFVQRLTGARVLNLRRRAKYLLADLDRGGALLMHLGMTGRFEVEGALLRDGFALAAPADAKHAHILFETDEGVRITFYDARRFGFMDLVEEDDPRLRSLGPEPLGPDFDAALLARAFAGRRQGPKTLLLDQSVVAGLGNIYVCESLHRARISPTRAAGSIAARRLEPLVAAVQEVLGEAIEAGGSSLRDFAAANGELGYFQHSFRVYDREGEPCPNRGCRGVIHRTVQSGRSTFFCPVCQT
jgi:formamidopyrimidine-DNA glycosylase